MAKRHTKPSQESAGGIISKEMPIQISNVAYVDPKTNKPTRLGIKIDKTVVKSVLPKSPAKWWINKERNHGNKIAKTL